MNRIFLIVIFMLVTICAQSQVKIIRPPQGISKETVVHRYRDAQKGTVAEIYVKGEISYSSPSGYVRILAKDKSGMEFLVYESFSLLASETGKDVFGPIAMETEGLYSYTIEDIRVVAKDATVSNLEVYSIEPERENPLKGHIIKPLPPIEKLIGATETKSDYIEKMNRNLKADGGMWCAKETPLSRMSYEEKKRYYGGEVPQLYGFEYYGGGVFELKGPDGNEFIKHEITDPRLPKRFDWRYINNATEPSSPYFQDPNYGRMTPVNNQDTCGSCWAQSVISLAEFTAKFYKNTTYNFDFSDQQILTFSNGGTCTGGYPEIAAMYAHNNGIVDSQTFPYIALNGVRNEENRNKINHYLYKYWPGDTVQVKNLCIVKDDSIIDNSSLKKALLQGPMSCSVRSLRHAMLLVGYKPLEVNDYYYYGWPRTAHDHEYRLGRTIWLFKNSYGPNSGDHGYFKLLTSENNLQELFRFLPEGKFDYKPANAPDRDSPELRKAILGDVEVHDYDGDGYYYWGIGPRPDHLLPADAQLEEDGNDNDHTVGPMDEFGRFKTLQEADLYIRDNNEDTGIQPNLSIKNEDFWSSPDIWVRNIDDKKADHQNPVAGKQNYVYARITNRGTKTSEGGKLTVYWTKAGTNLQWPDTWDGTQKVNGVSLGGKVGTIDLPAIEPGKTVEVRMPWVTPSPADYTAMGGELGDKNSWHFCLLAMAEASTDHLPQLGKYPNLVKLVGNYNNIAQKNVTVIEVDEGTYSGTVTLRNHLDQTANYSIDVIDISKDMYGVTHTGPMVADYEQKSIYDVARVQVEVSTEIYKAAHGGEMPMFTPGEASPLLYEMTPSYHAIENINMPKQEAGLIKLNVHFTKPINERFSMEKYRILLRHKDKDGNIIGGETYDISRSRRVANEVNIDSTFNAERGEIVLNAEAWDSNSEYIWYNEENKVLAKTKAMAVSPYTDATYRVEATSLENGYQGTAEITTVAMEPQVSISPNPVSDVLHVRYNLPEGEYVLTINPITETTVVRVYNLDATQKELDIDVANLPSGIYVLHLNNLAGGISSSYKFIKK